jgi:hypothetical protein
LIQSDSALFFGLTADKTGISKSGNNEKQNVFFIAGTISKLYSKDSYCVEFTKFQYKKNMKVGWLRDKKKKTISMYDDGKLLGKIKNFNNIGIAFQNVDKKIKLYPCFDIYSSNEIEFIKGKYKK